MVLSVKDGYQFIQNIINDTVRFLDLSAGLLDVFLNGGRPVHGVKTKDFRMTSPAENVINETKGLRGIIFTFMSVNEILKI